ncbi:MAG: hypothetical protein H6Q04_1977 [Acidobacteria bacterium]|jgi:hypothetical protein|nr:hypothetical protein [Acidobacteriota bacterium]
MSIDKIIVIGLTLLSAASIIVIRLTGRGPEQQKDQSAVAAKKSLK